MTQEEKSPNPPITKIEDGLYLGDSISSRRKKILQEHHITAVVSIKAGRWNHWSQPWYTDIITPGHHIYIPCNDSMTHDLLPDLARICDFISSSRDPDIGSNVLVHCDKGISRSATAVIAFLMRTYQWSFDTASAFVGEKRRIRPNQNFKEQLQVWEAVEYKIWEDEGKVPKPAYAAYLAIRAGRLKDAGLTGDEPIDIQSL